MRFGRLLAYLILHCLWSFWKKDNKWVRYSLAGITVLAGISLLISCTHYRVTTTWAPSGQNVKDFQDLGKVLVVHQYSSAHYVKNLKFKEDTLELHLGPSYKYEVEEVEPGKTTDVGRYKSRKGEERVLNEIHLYVTNTYVAKNDTWLVAHKDLIRVDVYKHDAVTTFIASLLGILWIPALIFLLLVASGNSCPFIYVYNGADFEFVGEIYGGAIYPPLERHDYLQLADLAEDDGVYRLKISNQLKEVQHTNLMELMVFDHPAEVDVLVDKYGQAHIVQQVDPPVSALSLEGMDVLPLVEQEDSLVYAGRDPSKNPPLLDGMILTFERPENMDQAKLVIEARNSFWLDFVHQNFMDMLGSSYNLWLKGQKNGTKEDMTDWSLSQNIPLSVYLQKEGEWVFQDFYHTIGPLAGKKDILVLDLEGVEEGPIQIKLESGAYFWEVGYVGLDNNPSTNITAKLLSMDEALTETGESTKDKLLFDDELYYIQAEIGNEATLTFPVPEMADDKRTVFLHSKGYYQILKDSKGIPKVRALKEISKEGNFNVYSNELMQAMLKEYMLDNE
ncbi:MAG: hypothetical protein ABFS28_05195 [Bacteroidota bacterium]